jgi:hypothetical protein
VLPQRGQALNTKHKPFAVFWVNSTTQAEFFDEWSRLGVINVGGWHFNEQFNNALRPVPLGRLHGRHPHGVQHRRLLVQEDAGQERHPRGFARPAGQERKLGILTQAFPVTKKNALDLYSMVTGGKCGTKADAAEPGLHAVGHRAGAADRQRRRAEAQGRGRHDAGHHQRPDQPRPSPRLRPAASSGSRSTCSPDRG